MRDEQQALVRITLNDGVVHEIDVTKLWHDEILRRVLTTAGVEKSLVEQADQLLRAQIAAESPNKIIAGSPEA